MDRTSGLVVAFFEAARAVGLGNQRHLNVSPDDLLAIARNPAGRAEFQRELKSINDDDLRRLIVEFVLDLADTIDDMGSEADRRVDLVDRAVLTISASATVAGVGTLIAKAAAVGGLAGPMGMLTGGVCGLIAAGFGRTVLKYQSDRSKSDSKKIRRLVN